MTKAYVTYSAAKAVVGGWIELRYGMKIMKTLVYFNEQDLQQKIQALQNVADKINVLNRR